MIFVFFQLINTVLIKYVTELFPSLAVWEAGFAPSGDVSTPRAVFTTLTNGNNKEQASIQVLKRMGESIMFSLNKLVQ